MTDHDDSTAKEIAREAARVLPLVGCPRWALWLGTLLAVVLYVVAKRLIPSIGRALAEALKNAKVEPLDETQPIPSDGGASGPGVPVETGRPPETESGSGG